MPGARPSFDCRCRLAFSLPCVARITSSASVTWADDERTAGPEKIARVEHRVERTPSPLSSWTMHTVNVDPSVCVQVVVRPAPYDESPASVDQVSYRPHLHENEAISHDAGSSKSRKRGNRRPSAPKPAEPIEMNPGLSCTHTSRGALSIKTLLDRVGANLNIHSTVPGSRISTIVVSLRGRDARTIDIENEDDDIGRAGQGS